MSYLTRIRDTLAGKAPWSAKRSSKWPAVRRAVLHDSPYCAVCGGTEKLEVHHIRPFHLRRDLELDRSNLIVLCESKKLGVTCHQFCGHLGNYRLANPDVIADSQSWSAKLRKARR